MLKAGAAYLPIDPDYPAERIAYMLADARPVCLVTTADTVADIPACDGWSRWSSTRRRRRWSWRPARATTRRTTDRGPLSTPNAAYVIYTSGSTGRPKGVVLSHAGVAKLVATQSERFGIGPDSRVLQFASPSFDVAFWDLCLGLLSGGRLVVVPAERRVPGAPLTDYATATRHHLHDPAARRCWPPCRTTSDLPPAATLLAGTERVSPELVGRCARGRMMFNAYGPTEATVNSTLGLCDPDIPSGSIVPIGVPDPGTGAYVLDGRLRPVPAGVRASCTSAAPGWPAATSAGPDLTAERFVADPFGRPGSGCTAPATWCAGSPTGGWSSSAGPTTR